MKLKRKGRFFGICLVLLICINVVAFRPKAENPENYRSIEVQSGQTLWQIASVYVPEGEDLRAFVWELKKINHLENSNLYPHQILQIPVAES